jgi:hypothetical protein
MNERQQNIARALSKHPPFKPCRGMTGVRDAPEKPDNLRPELVVWGRGSEADFIDFGCIPDLCDPATVGALEQLACSLTRKPCLSLCWLGDMWIVSYGDRYYTDDDDKTVVGDTRGEAWANLILSVKP